MKIFYTFVLSCLLFLFISCTAAAAQFDSKRVARAEAELWQAYYEKDYAGLMQGIVSGLSEQFDLSLRQAIHVGSKASEAAGVFSQLSGKSSQLTYDQRVLPVLIVFFSRLKSAVDGSWDADLAAKAELNWWVLRRQAKQNHPENVGRAIAKVYVLLYGKHNQWIEKAGLLRAKAAQLRDKQSRRGRVDWNAVQKLLEDSYSALLKGIEINETSP